MVLTFFKAALREKKKGARTMPKRRPGGTLRRRRFAARSAGSSCGRRSESRGRVLREQDEPVG